MDQEIQQKGCQNTCKNNNWQYSSLILTKICPLNNYILVSQSFCELLKKICFEKVVN